MLAETALGVVAKAVLSYVAKEGITAVAPPERLKSWVGREPQQLACQVALARALNRFERGYPRWSEGFFDEHFLAHRGAPVLARALSPVDDASASDLAGAWAEQLGFSEEHPRVRELEPAAATFVGWWQLELRERPEFHALFDSRALDSIAASSQQTAEALGDLRDELDRVLLRARYPALEDYVDWPSRQMVRSPASFVGREWVFALLDGFRERHRCGYVRLVAEAGLGKTALATAAASYYGAPVFFFNEIEGRVRPERCLNHLSVELIVRYGLAHDRLPDHAGEDSGFFSRVLEEAASGVEALWLVIDALDEAQSGTAGAGSLPLPERLPAGVFVVVTHRPGRYPPAIAAGSGTALEQVRITANDVRQQTDVARYLRDRAEHDETVIDAIGRAQPRVTTDEFIAELARASEGNFMYLGYVLDDMTNPQLPGLADQTGAVNLFALPRGLPDYYQRMWDVIAERADTDWQRWETLQRPLIERLAVAAEPITLEWLASHTGRPPKEVQRHGLNAWQRFLQHSDGPQARWRIIHQSFRDFLAETNELDLDAAHHGVADYYLADHDRWPTHGGYALRHLTTHLRHAGENDRLYELVDDPAWQITQRLHDPSGARYLNDVAHAWSTAVESDAKAIEQGREPPLLYREISCALAIAEQHAQSAGLPPALLGRLVMTGMWTSEQAISTAATIPDPGARVRALAALAPQLPEADRPNALSHALTAATG